MPEIPTQYSSEHVTDSVYANTADTRNDQAQMNAFFDYAKDQVAPQPGIIDLFKEDYPSLDYLNSEGLPHSAVVPPVEATAPMSRAQEIIESLSPLPSGELVRYSRSISRSVVTMRRSV